MEQDKASITKLVERYGEMVAAIAWKITRDAEETEEVYQETFLKYLEAAGRIKDPKASGAYLRKVAITKSLNRLKKRMAHERAREKVASTASHHRPPSPYEQTALKELGEIIRLAVAKLPKRQGYVFFHHIVAEESYEEIAASLSCKIEAVRSNLYHAIKRLREIIAPYLEEKHYKKSERRRSR